MSSTPPIRTSSKQELLQRAADGITWICSQVDTREQMDCCVLLLATTELDSSEVLALTWADLDLDRGAATVTRVNQYAKGVIPSKSPRTVEIPIRTCEALRNLRAAQGKRLGTYWKHLVVEENGTLLAASDLPIVCNLKGLHIPPRELADWWRNKAHKFDCFGWSLPNLKRAQRLVAAIDAEAGR